MSFTAYEAFKTIVGGGINACTLHYTKNRELLVDGELVLLDAGVENEYYAADITRTFPVNGKFTQEQKAIYEAVLATQLAVIAEVKPGICWDYLQKIADKNITEQLVKLGLLSGSVEDLLAKQTFKTFFMHRIGHWLGSDAHDVGKYFIENNGRILEPGMVFTVEPGVYITPNISWVDSKWHNIGVRIEDNILVTESGYEVLTSLVPKTVSEIENVMEK